MSSKFEALPDEVVQAILFHTSPSAALALQQTCRRFVHIVNEPLLWKEYCRTSFRYWDKRHEIQTRRSDPKFTDWKSLYARRLHSSQTTRSSVDRIIEEELARLDRLQEIIEVGYDSRDDLLELYRSSPSSPNHLAQRYWSHTALGCVQRLIAMDELAATKNTDTADVPDFERPLGALDMFILEEREEGDIYDIFTRLNSYVASVRSAHPNIDELSPRQRAITVAAHLQEKTWVGIQDGRHYHSLDHMFLGVSLFSTNRNSVPLISAVIYCYVARQFNLRAAPCSYPFHVHALVQPPYGVDLDGHPLADAETVDLVQPRPDTHLYMDPFRSAEPVALSTLETQLRFIAPASPPAQTLSYLLGADPTNIAIRTAHNILSSPSHYSGPPLHRITASLATYAALAAIVALSPPSLQTHQHVALLTQHLLENFEHDVHLFHRHILPLTSTLPDSRAYHRLLAQLRDRDHQSPVPKYRAAPPNEAVRFRVGQVFRHRRFGYLAAIYGWDPSCRMREQWINANGVDGLSRGRGQPFYDVLVEDESRRYVAEENVVLLEPEEREQIDVVDRFPIEIGKWFRRWDRDAGCFVSNVRAEYPDD